VQIKPLAPVVCLVWCAACFKVSPVPSHDGDAAVPGDNSSPIHDAGEDSASDHPNAADAPDGGRAADAPDAGEGRDESDHTRPGDGETHDVQDAGTNAARERTERINVPTEQELASMVETLATKGLCVDDFEFYVDDTVHTFSAALSDSSAKCRVVFSSSLDEVNRQAREAYDVASLRLTHIEIYEQDEKLRYAAVLKGGGERTTLKVGLLWSEFLSAWQDAESHGLRMIDFESFLDAGVRKYAGVFEPGTYRTASWMNAEWQDFYTHWKAFEKDGLYIVDLDVHNDGDRPVFSGIFREGGSYFGAWLGASSDDFEQRCVTNESQGEHLYVLESYLEPNRGRVFAGLFKPLSNWQPDPNH
jgi:hypothetical protein